MFEKMRVKMINILFVFMYLVTSSLGQRIDGIQISTVKEDSKLERELKLINKLAVKSIQTKFGYIVDCIDINKQPTFDHPLLKNHELQRKPSFRQTKVKTNVNNSPAKPKIKFEKVSCPKGTVPIRRTTNDDLIRVKSLLNTQISTQHSHIAEVVVTAIPGDGFTRITGINSVYNPKVEKDQTSAAHLWIENGNADDTNKIIAGWHVSPHLHGDDATYIYSLWTSDNFKKTGCYNVQCSGFVQTDKQVYLGARVDNTSIYGGLMIELPISIQQDQNTKNWWLSMANKDIGYFPAALFSNMATADQLGWGGRTTSLGNLSPPMGSGHLPDNNLVHTCYFIQTGFSNLDSRRNEKPITKLIPDKPECYGVKFYVGVQGRAGNTVQFGGPGGNCGN